MTSPTTARAIAGDLFSHQLQVKSRIGGVTYSVSEGPEGIGVNQNGLVTWKVTKSFVGKEVPVVLSIADASDKAIFTTLWLKVR